MKNFKEPENLAVLTCTHVVNEKSSILFVSHDEDDEGWQFLCGADHHNDKEALVVALDEIVNMDSSVIEVSDMPPGFCATRNKFTSKWILKI